MKTKQIVKLTVLFVILFVANVVIFAQQTTGQFLQNDLLKVEFNDKGLVSISDTARQRQVCFKKDNFSITLNGRKIASNGLKPSISKDPTGTSISYGFDTGQYILKAVYELKPGWRFVSKQILIEPSNLSGLDVNDVEVFKGEIENSIISEHMLSRGRYGASLRLSQQAGQAADFGIFMLLQNFYNIWKRQEEKISLSYKADMQWKAGYGVFVSDRCCIGTYGISGVKFPTRMLPEWIYLQKPQEYGGGDKVDYAEIEAVVNCVRAFLLVMPEKSIRVHIGWCENDYQIDTATEGGRIEYERILDRAAGLGCKYVLYTPHNSQIAPLSENRDAWGWESLLWFNMGQKIRKGEWIPSRDKFPDAVQEMLDYAKSKNLKLMAYVYPTVPFMQNPEWTEWLTSKNQAVGGYAGPDTGVRSFQDWLVDKVVDFVKATGCGGFSFDHWWIAYDDASSKYQQWYGCRRILGQLRQRLPDIVIDGRQQYHQFGPWTWVSGSYPHPMGTDEQPGSFKPFTDLHTDRISADRQRYIAWWYRMTQFCPVEILPGFITHQTQRSDAKGEMHRDTFRSRDWDYLGWKYSVLSSIATAPFNHVVNFIPARDEQEFKNFSAEDRRWFQDWLDWSDRNIEYLRNVRPIMCQPMVGCVDGTSAIKSESGFVFLFNPNYRRLAAEFTLDKSIGLLKGSGFIIKELYPQKELLISNKRNAFWNYGDKVQLVLDGTTAMVLELKPAPRIKEPILFNCTGKTSLKNGNLEITEVSGEIGSQIHALILLPDDQKVKAVTVNSTKIPFTQTGNTVYTKIIFTGKYFARCQQIGSYDPNFAGSTFNTTFTIPGRIFEQLKGRKQKWPINYTEDDLIAPWLGPWRLLLYICIAEPADTMQVSMKIDGKDIELKKAYNAVYSSGGQHTFLGFFTDVSTLHSDTEHTVELTLPDNLKPGQFQGLFFENVETEYTSQIAAGK